MTDPAPAPASATAAAAEAPGADVPTVLSALHALLRAHVAAHPSPTLPYLHPYAPLPPLRGWKGKARAGGDAGSLKGMREAMELARGVLGRSAGPGAPASPADKERIRVARAMREVITHESVLLPLSTVLSGLPPAPRPVGALCTLPPAELVSALGTRLGLQVFAEDSQFGLLRTSLTLAGSRFVVDIDLEADAAGDKTEPPTAVGTPVGLTDTPATPAPPPLAERGKIRLAKLSANHITPAGETGKADWVGAVLRAAVEAHLEHWNTKNRAGMEDTAKALQAALSELKSLDELAEASSADLFADLETLAAGVQRLCAGEEGWKVYPDTQGALFPSFRLLDASPGVRNPAWRLRPAGDGEDVPPLPEEDTMAVDEAQAAPPEEPAACKGKWVLEYVDDTPSIAGRGLVVRRTWLTPAAGEGDPWSPAIKVEGLLAASEATSSSDNSSGTGSDGAPAPLFVGGEYVHRAPGGVTQHWTLGGPGPEGYVVGRVGMASWAGLRRAVAALRAQLVLDVLFMMAFSPDARQAADDGGDAEDDDGDVGMEGLDELESAPTDIAVTATLEQRGMRVVLPRDGDSCGAALVLELAPAEEPPYVAVRATCNADAEIVARAGADEVDAVAIVRRVLAAMKP